MILYHGRVGSLTPELSCEFAYSESLLGDKAIYLADTQRAGSQYADPNMLENRQKARYGHSVLFEVEVHFERLAVLTLDECSHLTTSDMAVLKPLLDDQSYSYLDENRNLMSLYEFMGASLIPALKACGFDGLKHDSEITPILAATMADGENSYAVFYNHSIKNIIAVANP